MAMEKSKEARPQKVRKISGSLGKYVNVIAEKLDDGTFIVSDTDEKGNTKRYTAQNEAETQEKVSDLVSNRGI